MTDYENYYYELINLLNETIKDIDFTRIILRRVGNDLRLLRKQAKEAYLDSYPLGQLFNEYKNEDKNKEKNKDKGEDEDKSYTEEE